MKLRFGASPSPFLWWRDVKEFDKWISEVQSCGYDGIFIPDHYNVSVPEHGPSNELVDAWSALAYAAAKTEGIKLASCVSPIPRWTPSQLAKVISVVDLLSDGRVIAGLGAGIFPEEFVNYSPQGCFEEPRVRVERFVEGLQIMEKLWTEDEVNFEGKYYRLKNAVLLPKPKQKPRPPLWSGGLGPYMLKLTAKYFDAWMSHTGPPGTPTPDRYRVSVETVKRHLKKCGRDVSNFTFALFLHLAVPAEKTTDEMIKMVEHFVEAGCQYFIVDVSIWRTPIYNGKYIELIRKFAKEVMPSF